MNIFLLVTTVIALLIAVVLDRWLLRAQTALAKSEYLRRQAVADNATLGEHIGDLRLRLHAVRGTLNVSEAANNKLAHELLKARELTEAAENRYAELDASFRLPMTKMALEVFLAKMQGSVAYRLPEGLDLLADEVGNVLYMPGPKTEYPRRVFVYVCAKGAGKSISRKELHTGEAPAIQNQRVTFVLDDWLTMGEVVMKLRRAAESLLKEKANGTKPA